MNLISVDFTNTPCQNTEEQITLATHMAYRKPDHTVRFISNKYKVSICISYSNQELKISYSGGAKSPNVQLDIVLFELFGEPKSTFSKQSTLGTVVTIHFREWGVEVSKRIMKELDNPISNSYLGNTVRKIYHV